MSRLPRPHYDPDRHRLPVGMRLALTLVLLLVLAVWGLVRAAA